MRKDCFTSKRERRTDGRSGQPIRIQKGGYDQRINKTPNSQVDAIEEPQDLNAALSHSFEAAKGSHKNEIKMINKQNINNNYWPIKLRHHLKASSFLLNKM